MAKTTTRRRPKAKPPAPKKTVRARAPKRSPQKRSKTEEAMERRLETLEPNTPRYEALRTAIEFKRSWLELAERLTELDKSGEYKGWGYRTFEAYAQHELHLRRDTVGKLLRSYEFLSSYEPKLVEAPSDRGEPVALPSFEAIDVLREARSNPYLSERDYRELRDQVFREDPSPAQVRKAVRELAPEPVSKGDHDPLENLRKCLALAERLYGMIVEQENVPERVSRAMEEVVGGLRQLIEE
jgi:hypothetical protein